jgi:hypothetical protein
VAADAVRPVAVACLQRRGQHDSCYKAWRSVTDARPARLPRSAFTGPWTQATDLCVTFMLVPTRFDAVQPSVCLLSVMKTPPVGLPAYLIHLCNTCNLSVQRPQSMHATPAIYLST